MTKFNLAAAVFTIIGAVVLSSFTLLQTTNPAEGLRVYRQGAHDAFWHIGLLQSIKKGLPPANPLITGEPLVGYHYLNDVVWVGVHYLTGISFFSLYLRWAPLVLAGLFSFTVLKLFLSVFPKKIIAYLGASLTVFGANFVYLTPWIFPQAQPTQYMFWLDQTIHLGLNQQMLLSLSIVNVIIWLWMTKLRSHWWLVGLLTGILIVIKVYGAALLLPMLAVLGGYYWLKDHDLTGVKISLISLAVALPLLWWTGNKNGFPFILEPGWFFKVMFESSDHLNYPRWEIIRQGAVAQGQWLKLATLWVIATIAFFAGNFGIKIIGVGIVGLWLTKKRSQITKPWLLPLLIVLGSFLAVTPFIQKGIAWNSIQFLPYAYVPLTLLFVKFVTMVVDSPRWQISCLATALIISSPTTIHTLWLDLQPAAYVTVPASITQPLLALQTEYLDRELLVGSSLYNYSLVSAVTGRPVFWADPTILIILANDHLERQALIQDIERKWQPCSENQLLVQLTAADMVGIFPCPLVVPAPPVVILNLEQVHQ